MLSMVGWYGPEGKPGSGYIAGYWAGALVPLHRGKTSNTPPVVLLVYTHLHNDASSSGFLLWQLRQRLTRAL